MERTPWLPLGMVVLLIMQSWAFVVLHNKHEACFVDPDQYSWYLNSLEAEAQGVTVLRKIGWEGAFGREVHWSSPPRWVVHIGARATQALTGAGYSESLRESHLYSLAALHTLCMVLVFISACGMFNWRLAVWIVLAAFGIPAVWQNMFPLAFDHPSHILTGLMLFLLGIVGHQHSHRQRLSGIISGAGAGYAIWVSAVNSLPVIILVLAASGALSIAQLFLSEGKNKKREDPIFWLYWGAAAGAISTLGFGVEYSTCPTMLIEVNNPFYALALLGAGILMFHLDRQKAVGASAGGTFGVLLGCILISLPVFAFRHIGLGPILASPPTRNLIKGIAELQPVAEFTAFGPAIVILFAIIWIMWLGKTRNSTGLVILLLPAYAYLFIALEAYRLLVYMSLLASFAGIMSLWHIRGAKLRDTIFILLIGQGVVGLTLATSILLSPMIDHGYFYGKQTVAPKIAKRILSDKWASGLGTTGLILAPVDMGPSLAYFTGMRVISGPYWEAEENLLQGSGIASSRTDDNAKALLKYYGVTHLVLSEDSLHSQVLDLDPTKAQGGFEARYAKKEIGNLPGFMRVIGIEGVYFIYSLEPMWKD